MTQDMTHPPEDGDDGRTEADRQFERDTRDWVENRNKHLDLSMHELEMLQLGLRRIISYWKYMADDVEEQRLSRADVLIAAAPSVTPSEADHDNALDMRESFWRPQQHDGEKLFARLVELSTYDMTQE
jgi:hypothetical protein